MPATGDILCWQHEVFLLQNVTRNTTYNENVARFREAWKLYKISGLQLGTCLLSGSEAAADKSSTVLRTEKTAGENKMRVAYRTYRGV